jgi:hypothetical protein
MTIVLLVFIVMMAVSAQRQAELNLIESSLEDKRLCRETAFFMATLYSQGPGTQIEFELDRDINISTGRVIVGRASCPYLADVNETALLAGMIRARNVNGLVVLENA